MNLLGRSQQERLMHIIPNDRQVKFLYLHQVYSVIFVIFYVICEQNTVVATHCYFIPSS